MVLHNSFDLILILNKGLVFHNGPTSWLPIPFVATPFSSASTGTKQLSGMDLHKQWSVVSSDHQRLLLNDLIRPL